MEQYESLTACIIAIGQDQTNKYELMEAVARYIQLRNENPGMIRLRNKDLLRPKVQLIWLEEEEAVLDPEEELFILAA